MSGRTATRSSQVPLHPNPYEPFVRGVLVRLTSELNSGRLNIRTEANGARYVVEAPGHTGRNIVVPAAQSALKAPSSMPARSPRGLLSRYVVKSAGGQEINVPKAAIVRDYDYPLPSSCSGPCRGCEYGSCPHGWKAHTIQPAGIIVLKVQSTDGMPCFGWYVRFEDKRKELVRVPDPVIQKMSDFMRSDEQLRHSSLVTQYVDSVESLEWDEDASFHEEACKRFARYRTRVCTAVAKERKRKRKADIPSEGTGETCVICLEEKPTSRKRCRHDHCGTHVCDTCHSDSRGLCPVCDRSSINADYPCSSCQRLTRLSQYGFPCAGCDTHSLCATCYGEFGACGACETA